MATKSLDGSLTKKAHIKQQWTEQQVSDMLSCMDHDTGYLHFAKNFFHIQHPVKGKMLFDPFQYQIGLLNSYHTKRFNVNMLPRQSGKALSLNTPIPTPSGWTTMGDIQVGDIILSNMGNPTTVTFATEIMYNHTCYEVEFDNGESIIADAEHLWKVSTANWSNKSKILTTDEIKKYKDTHSLEQGLYIDITEPVQYEYKSLQIHPYILGLWLGDGYSGDGRYVQSTIDNIEMIQYISESGYTVSEPSLNSNNSERRNIIGLRTLLNGNNLLKNKHIPTDYMFSSIDQRLELLRGLMDTDGSCTKNGNCEFYQKNFKLIEQVRTILSSLGIKSRCSCKIINGVNYYTLKFSTTKNIVFKLKRKAERQMLCKGHAKNTRLYINKITKASSVPVRCIQVDNDEHMFLCGKTMIPTHNTTCASAYLLWYAMFNPDQTILVAAHKFTGAQEIMQRIRYGYELCPDFLRAGVVSYNKGSIEFDNGSRIVSQTTTGTTGRGMSISLLYCDEFAFVQPNIANEFWTSISPTLATGGRAIITSTPNSDEDQFALIWKESKDTFDEYGNERTDGLGRNGFYGYKSDWWDHPDRDENWKKEELGRIGEERFRREYNCEFLVYDETLVSSLKLADMIGREPIFKMGQVRWYKKPTAGNIYLAALDPSLGTGGDYGGIQVFELPSFTQVAEWQHNLTPIQGQVKIYRDILRYIQDEIGMENTNAIYWSVENNTVGDSALVVIENLGEETFPGLFLSEPLRKGHVKKFRKGFNTTFGNKISSCARLKYLIEEEKMIINSRSLISELKSFIAFGVSFKAKQGQHDDLVSAVLLVVRMSVVLAEWDPNVFETLSIDGVNEDWEAPLPVFVSSYF